MGLGEVCKRKAITQIADLLETYWLEIKEAYLRRDDDEKLSIKIGVSFSSNKKQAEVTDVETSIGFVKEKIKDSRLDEVMELQRTLFDDKEKTA